MHFNAHWTDYELRNWIMCRRVHGNNKIYLEIYYLGCDNAAKLQYSFFISISIVYVMQ